MIQRSTRGLVLFLLAATVAEIAQTPAVARQLPETSGGVRAITARLPVAQRYAAPSGTDPSGPAEDAAVPSVQYRHAEAHADDVIAFAPGERVSVPFRPRADDRREVDGGPPNALPEGRATGQQMRDAGPGAGSSGAPEVEVRSDREATASIDQPTGPATSAELASATARSGEDVASAAIVGAGSLRREVFGFLPYWVLGDSSTILDWRTLSTVAYFSVGCTGSGGLWKRNADGSVATGWAGWTSSRMTSVINQAHRHGTRVVLTVSCFGWTAAGAATQRSVLGSAAARRTFARQAAAAVRDRGADGVNLDFEPIPAGYAEEFTALVRAVRRELNEISPGYQLTFDALPTVGNQPIAEATGRGGADAVVIMGYDYRTASSSVAGSISPLSGPGYDLTDTVRAFTAKVPASRLILGVPYYGRAWSTSSDELHARTLDPRRYGSVAEPYYRHAADLAAAHGRRYDRVEEAPWTAYRRRTCTRAHGCVTSWRQLYYDDAASLRLRYDLVNRAGLRGAAIWALGYDGTRPELRAALAAKFRADRTPPRVGVRTLPERVGDEGFRVSWPAWDSSPIRDFDVQVSIDGRPFAPWLSRTKLRSAIFLAGHGRTYVFRVRATDVHGNSSAWTSSSLGGHAVPSRLLVGGFGRVVVEGLKLRSVPSTTGRIITQLSIGTPLVLTGGPVRSGGYTWFKVAGPVRQWRAVAPLQAAGWVAAYGNGETHLVPRRPVHATRVVAGIVGLRLADGGARVLTPDGDGRQDTLALSWTNRRSFDRLDLRVFRANGTLLGTVRVPARKAERGPRRWSWDGWLGGARVPAGAYVLQLRGRRGTTWSHAPSASPVSFTQLARFGVVVGSAIPTTVLTFDPPASPTRARELTWRLRFGGPIGGLSSGAFILSGTATGCRVGTPAGSGSSWTVTLRECSPGTVALALRPGSVFDSVRNWGPPTKVSAPPLLIDRARPSATQPRVALLAGVALASSSAAARLPAVVSWSGRDPGGAGVRSYDVQLSTDGGPFATIASGITATGRGVALLPGHHLRFQVRARDRAANVGPWVAGPTLVAHLRQEGWAPIAWRGAWQRWSSPAHSGGSVRAASEHGASLRVTFTGRAIAWVSNVGPGHGAARVYLDGVRVATISTYSPSTQLRRIVFARSWSKLGTHTLRIVVVGTPGRPRVDLDALGIVR